MSGSPPIFEVECTSCLDRCDASNESDSLKRDQWCIQYVRKTGHTGYREIRTGFLRAAEEGGGMGTRNRLILVLLALDAGRWWAADWTRERLRHAVGFVNACWCWVYQALCRFEENRPRHPMDEISKKFWPAVPNWTRPPDTPATSARYSAAASVARSLPGSTQSMPASYPVSPASHSTCSGTSTP